MKIGHIDNQAVAATVNERKPGATAPNAATAAANAATAAASDASAKVALSSTAAHLAATGSDGVFDADKVARISAAIQNGSFSVNADAIADKLISNAQELLGKASDKR